MYTQSQNLKIKFKKNYAPFYFFLFKKKLNLRTFYILLTLILNLFNLLVKAFCFIINVKKQD